jgi:hypothetical protein
LLAPVVVISSSHASPSCASSRGVKFDQASREVWSAGVAMQLASRLLPSNDEIERAESLLGREDPLVEALDRLAVAVAQLIVLLAVLLLSVAAVIAGVQGAVPFAIAGAVVSIGSVCRTALRASDRRERACDLLISGRGDVALAVVDRERSRLLDPRRRETLARSYESLGDEPSASGTVPCRASVIVSPRVMATVRPELALVAVLLRDDAVSVRGVAAAERLITTGGSSLFGRDHEMIRQDLRRIAHLLRR